jgi:phosphoribosylformimino-5-aminoimidazole carboxamide ribotide isomerase
MLSLQSNFAKKMRIITAIDIIEGQCVRLTEGDYEQKKVYHSHPLEIAKMYEAEGIQYLHLVDLDGAKAGHIVNWKILEEICSQTTLHVDFGGGLKSNEDLKIAFDAGAKQITGGSIAVKNRELFLEWIKIYGASKIILGADVRHEMIAVSGWQQTTDIQLFDFLEDYIQQGITTVICTDIQKDGKLQGVSLDLYQKILEKFPDLNLIASGGVTDMQDIDALQKINIYGTIIGKALYEDKIRIRDLAKYL